MRTTLRTAAAIAFALLLAAPRRAGRGDGVLPRGAASARRADRDRDHGHRGRGGRRRDGHPDPGRGLLDQPDRRWPHGPRGRAGGSVHERRHDGHLPRRAGDLDRPRGRGRHVHAARRHRAARDRRRARERRADRRRRPRRAGRRRRRTTGSTAAAGATSTSARAATTRSSRATAVPERIACGAGNDQVDNDFTDIIAECERGTDNDGDGFSTAVDCNDARANVFPGAPDPENGVDEDCDGRDDVNLDRDGDDVPGAAGLQRRGPEDPPGHVRDPRQRRRRELRPARAAAGAARLARLDEAGGHGAGRRACSS